MEMDDETAVHAVVQGSFDRRAAVLGQARGGEVVLDLLLALGGIVAVFLGSHRVQQGAVQHGEAVLGNGGEGVAAGLYPEAVRRLEGRVAAAGDDETCVSAVFAGNGDKFLYFFHFASTVLVMISSPASTVSRPFWWAATMQAPR